MIKFSCLVLALGSGLMGSAALAEEIPQQWQPSTLSEKTQTKVNEGVEHYQKCLNEETRLHMDDVDDSRRITDQILARCESKLTAVKTAFDAEKVPGPVSDRYIRSKRSKAAQQIIRVVMSHEALRSSQGQGAAKTP